MSRLTSSSQALYDTLTGRRVADRSRAFELPVASGPTLVKVKDPMIDVDEVVELLEEASHEGRVANSWLRRRKRKLARNEAGEVELEGRACCMRLAKKLDARLHRLHLPSEHTCECGTVWRVEIREREERKHG